MEYLALWVLLRIVRFRLEDHVAAAWIDAAEAVMEEALHLGQASQRGLKVLRNRINPVLSMWICLDFLLILVKFKSDIELEALGLSETRLHYSISSHVDHIILVQLLLRVILFFIVDVVLRFCVDQRLTSALRNFLHRKSQLLLTLFNGGDEDFAHSVLKLDLDDALELLHRFDELRWDLYVHILLLVMSHLILPL